MTKHKNLNATMTHMKECDANGFLTFFVFIILSFLISLSARAQGPIGYVNANDGICGITGGMGGDVVRVNTVEAFRNAVADNTPRIVILEGKLVGQGVNRTKKCYFEVGSNKTILGAGADAELHGWGLNVQGKQNIIIRNLKIFDGTPDGIACRETHHVWIDHCDLASEYDTSKEDWDGLLDFTIGSSYLTCSWTKFHDHDKTSTCGSGTLHYEDNGKLRVTYHHNSFIHCNQRNPRIGYGRGHLFNNYYEQNGSYCVGYYTQAKVLNENCYFASTANSPFNQMYSSEEGNAMYAECGDNGSYFAKPLSSSMEKQPTGTDFDPGVEYSYAFALSSTSDVPGLVKLQAGPCAGLEREPILWPGNGMKYVTANTPLRWSAVENVKQQKLYFGSSPDNLVLIEGAESGYVPVLEPSTSYYWKVVTSFTDYADVATPVYQFTTADEKPAVPYPSDGEQNAQLREPTEEKAACTPLTLVWRPAFDANSYDVVVTEGEEEVINTTVAKTSCTVPAPRYGKEYKWRVAAITDNGRIESDLWTFSAPKVEIKPGKTEMESLARSGLVYPEYSDGSWYTSSGNWATVGEAGPGAMTGVWVGPHAMVKMSLTYWNETSGRAWMGISVNDEQVFSITGDKSSYAMVTKEMEFAVELVPGDEIRVDFYTESKMRCRIDYLTATVTQELDMGIVSVSGNDNEYNAMYNYSGLRVNPTAKGIIIKNGHKFVKL